MSQLINDGKNGLLVEVGDISQLAEAILKYKNINVEKNEFLAYQSDINKLLLDFKETTVQTRVSRK